MQIKNSLALQVVFDYLPERQVLCLQQLSKRFYSVVLPRYIDHYFLGLHTNKLFSYGVKDDDLFIYDTEERTWDVVPEIKFMYDQNQFKRYLNDNM